MCVHVDSTRSPQVKTARDHTIISSPPPHIQAVAPAAGRPMVQGAGATKRSSALMDTTSDHFTDPWPPRTAGVKLHSAQPSEFIPQLSPAISDYRSTCAGVTPEFKSTFETVTWIIVMTLTCNRAARGFRVEREEGLRYCPPLLCCCKVQACFMFANRSLFGYSPAPDLLK